MPGECLRYTGTQGDREGNCPAVVHDGGVHALLNHLLAADPAPQPSGSVDSWWRQHLYWAERFERPVELAAAGGFAADRLGWAFASGYHAALCRLLPGSPRDEKTALCATEDRGAHPRHIHTSLEPTDGGYVLRGHKNFVTLGPAASSLLIVASEGIDPAGRNRLRVVRIDAERAGVLRTAQPTLPFVPEVPHASIELQDVAVEPQEVLPGDGYTAYLKPFRTIEDLHVHAALLGWLVQVGRRSDWPDPVIERTVSLLCAVASLAPADPSSPAVHRALGGALAAADELVRSVEPLWSSVDADTAQRWSRDRGLLGIAGRARAARLEAARGR